MLNVYLWQLPAYLSPTFLQLNKSQNIQQSQCMFLTFFLNHFFDGCKVSLKTSRLKVNFNIYLIFISFLAKLFKMPKAGHFDALLLMKIPNTEMTFDVLKHMLFLLTCYFHQSKYSLLVSQLISFHENEHINNKRVRRSAT